MVYHQSNQSDKRVVACYWFSILKLLFARPAVSFISASAILFHPTEKNNSVHFWKEVAKLDSNHSHPLLTITTELIPTIPNELFKMYST